METADNTSRELLGEETRECPQDAPAPSDHGKPVLLEPDLDFIRSLRRQGGDSLKKCFQCGTCSSTCELSPDLEPFPRKEMAWAVWGMKDRLVEDPDIWLCHQCNDCSTRCPRGARPGDVLAAVRQETVAHYAVPGFLGRWVNEPACTALLLGIPAALLTLLLYIGSQLDVPASASDRIIYPYYNKLPHWLLNSFFILISVLVLAAVLAGAMRFWRAMKAADPRCDAPPPAKGRLARIKAVLRLARPVLRDIITHDKFATCTTAHSRSYSHMGVLFGFLALCLVSLWVVTARFNPLIPDGLIYPFGLLHPWKMLANLGGATIVAGCLWMIFERLKDKEHSGSFSDWVLIVTLLAVVITGFICEVLHFVRLEPHRHVAYFGHLVFVLALLMYLPYSKLAHIVYRTTALIYAEYSGRNGNDTAHTAGREEEP